MDEEQSNTPEEGTQETPSVAGVPSTEESADTPAQPEESEQEEKSEE